MASIFRKTAKGVAEIETRAHKLTPRLRSALILVDGKRSDDELRRMIPGQPDEALDTLATLGFIELASSGAATAVAKPAPATAPVAAMPAAAPITPAAPVDLAILRRDAVRTLTDLVGPMGEALALKIERSRTADEMRPLIALAAQIVANTRGRDKAAEFATRFAG